MGKTDWSWSEETQKAYNMLKGCITDAPILAMPDNDKLYKVEVDASDFAIGGILSQKQDVANTDL